MSQQELPPEPQPNESSEHTRQPQSGNDEDRDTVQPYYWSTQPAQSGQSVQSVHSAQSSAGSLPKDEPAGSYDEPVSQYDYAGDYASGYQPQETISSYPASNGSSPKVVDADVQAQGQQQRQQFQQQEQGRNPYSPDGDSFETGYRPYESPYNPYNAYGNEGGWQQQQQQQQPWMRPQRVRGNFRWIWIVLFILIFAGPTLRFAGDALAFLFPILFIGLIVVASAVFWSTIGSRRGRGPRGPGGFGGPGRRGPWGW